MRTKFKIIQLIMNCSLEGINMLGIPHPLFKTCSCKIVRVMINRSVSAKIGVYLNAVDNSNNNFEDDIENCEDENKKTACDDNSRGDYGVRHCCIDCHNQLKCLRCGTN